MATNKTSNSIFNTNAYVSQDWNGGYKLEVDITAQSSAKDWTLDFNLPYTIRAAYGVNVIDNGKGNYSISGQDDWQNLQKGETAKAIFVINENGQKAIVPEFTSPDSKNTIDSKPEKTKDLSLNPTLSPLSSKAISVGFEQHANNTIYSTDIQRQDWDVDWSVQMDKYSMITNEDAHSGDKSLKMIYPSNAQSNAGAPWQIPSQKEYYLSYWVKFDKDFDFDGPKYSGGKLPGLAGAGGLCSGGETCNGNNGFTSRYMWREDGKATMYLYHMDKPGAYGDDILLKGSDGSDKYFERGKWHNLIQRVRINDGNQSNGEIDVWMDQEQVLSMDNLKFVTNNQGIDTMYFSTFHGGAGSDWWPEREVNAYFDDFVVSTNAADVGL